MKVYKKILVYVYEDLLGDAILKRPFLSALRTQFPEAHITWCAGGGKSVYASSLKALAKDYLNDVVEMPVGRSWKELAKKSPLKDMFFDLIIDTQRDLKTTLALKKIPHSSFLSRTSGFLFSNFKPRKSEKPGLHLSAQLVFLLEVLSGKKIIPKEIKSTFLAGYKKDLQRLFPKAKSYIGLAPGAGNRKKCWPLERFIEVAHFIIGQGKAPVFLLGPAESEWYGQLKSQVPEALFPLQKNPSLLSDPLYTAAMGFFLESVVTNDSGVAHLLSLSDTKIISLFGPTKAEKVHPLTPNLVLVKAQDFNSQEMGSIPTEFIVNILKNN